MEEIIKIALKLIIEEPALIIGNILKSMRSIFLFVISIYLYKYAYGDFVLVKNMTELLDFFVNGFFLKPVAVFIFAWLVFDLFLNVCIENVFGFLYINQKTNAAKKEKEALNKVILLKQTKIKSKEQLKRFYYFAIYRYLKNKLHIKNISTEDIKDNLVNFKKIEVKLFNTISLAIIQLIILLFLINKDNIIITFSFISIIILIQFLKSKVIYYKILLEDILI